MGEPGDGANTASFGYRVRRRRLALDLTQAALARRVGCATVTIKKIERDERRPSRQMAGRLADVLDVPDAERAWFVAAGLGERPVDERPLAAKPVLVKPEFSPPEFPAALDNPDEGPPFVGREEELAWLDERLREALAGQGRIVFVEGEAGRGKTALLTRFARLAQDENENLVIAQGYCTAVAGLGDPYLPFRDILLTLVGDLETRGQTGQLIPGQVRRLWAFAPAAAATIAREGPHLLDALVPRRSLRRWGVAVDSSEGKGDQSGERLFEQLTMVLQAVARERPLLLLIDDLQWADAASVGLLFHLGRRLAGSRILLAGAYRPSEVAAAPADRPGRTLREALLEFRRLYGDIVFDLEAFDVDKERGLTDALLDREPNHFPEPFRVQLFWRTRGHPLFLVELLREMKARRYLEQDDEGFWVEGKPVDWEALPSRVTAVIEQRLARLGEVERRLLAAASVEGERFTAEIIAPLADLGAAEALRILTHALGRRHGLVREISGGLAGDRPLARFQFAHVMFQHYLYESLGDAERRYLHGEVAAKLESLYSEPGDGVLAALAHHYTAAGDVERAVPLLLQAGDRARNLYAHQEAIDHFQRAVTFLRDRGERETLARTLMKIGITYQTAFDYERAQKAFDEAFALWPEGARSDLARPKGAAGPALPTAPHPLRLLWFDPTSMDPTMGGHNLTAPVVTQLFSGLVTYGPESEIVPDIAYRWEIKDGGRRYVFHLRDDVFWSDGRPVTAHDFAFTYRRALLPETKAPVAGQLLESLKGARAALAGEMNDPEKIGVWTADDHTLIVEVETPTSYFIHNLAYYVSMPVPRHVVEAHGADWATPAHIVTNGPFRLAGWEPGRFMHFERNPRYHGSFSGNLEEVHLVLDQPREAQPDLYRAGKLDVTSNWFATVQEIDALRREFPGEYQRRPALVTMFYFIDLALTPFEDIRVRQALARALDLDRLSAIDLQGYVDPAHGGLVPPGMPGHVPGCRLAYDPDLARQLLAEAGFPGGHGFPEIHTTSSPFGRSMVPFLHESWQRELGLTARNLEFFKLTDWERHRKENPTHIIIGGWWADYPDPDNFLRVVALLDLPDWKNDRFAYLIERASRISDHAERMALYYEAEQILAAEAPLVPLAYAPTHLMLKPWVKRYPTPMVKFPGFWKDVILEPH